MKQTGSMTILEHLACAMEDLNNESFIEDKEKAKLLIEKSRALSELATQYTNVIKCDQEEKRLVIDAMDVAGKWNYHLKDLPESLSLKFNSDEK